MASKWITHYLTLIMLIASSMSFAEMVKTDDAGAGAGSLAEINGGPMSRKLSGGVGAWGGIGCGVGWSFGGGGNGGSYGGGGGGGGGGYGGGGGGGSFPLPPGQRYECRPATDCPVCEAFKLSSNHDGGLHLYTSGGRYSVAFQIQATAAGGGAAAEGPSAPPVAAPQAA